MSGEVKTQGTKLYLIDSNGALMTMACPTGISGLGGARSQIPSTCLDNTTDETFQPGLGTPGQVTVPFVFKPSEASQQELFALKETGAETQWLIGFSDGTDAPEVDSNGNFNEPTDRTSVEFTAYVADVNIDIATNELVRGTLLLQRSGSPEWHWPTA